MLLFDSLSLQLRHDFQLTSTLVHSPESNQGIRQRITSFPVLRLQAHGLLQDLDGLSVSASAQVNLTNRRIRLGVGRVDEHGCQIFQEGFVLASLSAINICQLPVCLGTVWITLEPVPECRRGAVEICLRQIETSDNGLNTVGTRKRSFSSRFHENSQRFLVSMKGLKYLAQLPPSRPGAGDGLNGVSKNFLDPIRLTRLEKDISQR